jgi:hypothetical protein
MPLRFRVLDEAKDELAIAAAWYDTERDGLGRETLLAYRAVIVHAIEFPIAGSPIHGVRTRHTRGGFCSIRVFPTRSSLRRSPTSWSLSRSNTSTESPATGASAWPK